VRNLSSSATARYHNRGADMSKHEPVNQAEPAFENSRTHERARHLAALPDSAGVVVLAIHPPATALRTPRVVVEVQLGPAVVVLTVARKRLRGRLEVRMPETRDGAPGVILPAEVQAEAEAAAMAAVRANPEAWRHLLRRGL
jgi:hypothetical protein